MSGLVTDKRFLAAVLFIFAAHLAATLVVTGARTAFYLFTVPLLLPVAGAESLAGRALWVVLVDAGAVALCRIAVHALTEPAAVSGVALIRRAQPRRRLSPAGHIVAAAVIAALGILLAVARDHVFVVAVQQPTMSGTFGVVERPIFTSGIGSFMPFILIGAGVDIARHLTFACTRRERPRRAASLVSRATTALVLAYLATGSIFNTGGIASGAPAAGIETVLERAASLALAALAVLSAAAAVRDWIELAAPGEQDEEACAP